MLKLLRHLLCRLLTPLSGGSFTIGFEDGSRLKILGNGVFDSSSLWYFSLPENAETIGHRAFFGVGFRYSSSVPKPVIIPVEVSKIGNEAFGAFVSKRSRFTDIEIRSYVLAKPAGAVASFPPGNNQFQNVIVITEITLP